MSELADAFADVRARIASACARVSRDPSEVNLVAVSKTHPAARIREAHALGQRVFGENYVQELTQKADELRELSGLRLHFIGHLQRNKARDVARVAHCVETLDSRRLADELAKRVGGLSRTLDVLIQVNVAAEEGKSGCALGELAELIAHTRALSPLKLRGLMLIPPHDEDPEQTRPHFRRLHALATEHGLAQRSMGMSHDLHVAVEEGATMVRVGSALFGARPAG